MIAIIDYGMGNLRSVQKAFELLDVSAEITSDRATVDRAEKVVLPGVGAIADMITELRRAGMAESVLQAIEEDKPFLGICLGFQALFETSEENGGTECLGVLPGRVKRFPESPQYVVPHMGWNDLTFKQSSNPLYAGLKPTDYVYFVHSFAGTECSDSVIATAEYGETVTAAVSKGNVYGCQFHPEKSGEVGLKILKAFTELKKENK